MSINLNIDFNATLEKFRENKVYNKKNYGDLLEKYECAVQRINELENKNSKNRLPAKEEVESIGSMLKLMGIEKLDKDGIRRLSEIQGALNLKSAK